MNNKVMIIKYFSILSLVVTLSCHSQNIVQFDDINRFELDTIALKNEINDKNSPSNTISFVDGPKLSANDLDSVYTIQLMKIYYDKYKDSITYNIEVDRNVFIYFPTVKLKDNLFAWHQERSFNSPVVKERVSFITSALYNVIQDKSVDSDYLFIIYLVSKDKGAYNILSWKNKDTGLYHFLDNNSNEYTSLSDLIISRFDSIDNYVKMYK